MLSYVDVAVIVPLEEEFDVALGYFSFLQNISTPQHIRFLVTVPGTDLRILLAKQRSMGRTACTNAALDIATEFNVGLFICLGIAGGLSNDVRIGDVCYTGTISDLLDNAKVTDGRQSVTKATKKQSKKESVGQGSEHAFSPTHYETPIEISVALNLDRLEPERKKGHEAWALEREIFGKTLIPNSFVGKDGKKEVVKAPVVREGHIACGSVSGSTDYNRKVKSTDRRVLAIETESGGLFAIAKRYSIPALTIRGISDYAGFGIDKNLFESGTNNQARTLAAANASSFLARQLCQPDIRNFIAARRGHTSENIPLHITLPTGLLGRTLLSQSAAFDSKLRDISPLYSLTQSKGYRLPIPRIRIMENRYASTISHRDPIEIRDALCQSRILILQMPLQYPDRALSWIAAKDLISAQIGDKQLLPCVIEATELKRPKRGIRELIGPSIFQIENLAEAQLVIIIDEFDFDSRTQVQFLLEEIEAAPACKFIVTTRNKTNLLLEGEFCRKTASTVGKVCEVSFLEISHFLQKKFEMDGAQAEVVAVRLNETFHSFKLPAHPSYFAGIPANIVSALLQANRRAELIELAVAGYLSYVVSQDDEPVALSRTTREKFLTALAYELNINKKSFTEVELTNYADAFAKKFDFKISPARFVTSFIANGILLIEGDNIRFTLPFMEAYLLAKELHSRPEDAVRYFDITAASFDVPTFTLCAEIGISSTFVEMLIKQMDLSIAQLEDSIDDASLLSEGKLYPALLKHADRISKLEKKIEQAIVDVRSDNDKSQEKQRLLDAADRIHERASRRSEDATDSQDSSKEEKRTIERDALACWYVAVSLLGAGAERLEAHTKRVLAKKILSLSALIISSWTEFNSSADFEKIRDELLSDNKAILELANSGADSDIAEAKRIMASLVDILEFAVLTQPFRTITATVCEEARDSVLAESILHTEAKERLERLVRGMWLSDINPKLGCDELRKAIKELPKAIMLRVALSAQLIQRVYWKHWEKENRLKLLSIAEDCVKISGFKYDKAKLHRIIERDEEHNTE